MSTFKSTLKDHFKKGMEVEISSNDDGFRGAWYAGTVIHPANSKNKVSVEYKTLVNENDRTKPLREKLDILQLRPPPPREYSRSFEFSAEVDAYHNDGWWEGVITKVLPLDRYSVYFRGTKEQIDFGHLELRVHREWANGQWIPPFEEQVPTSTETKTCKDDMVNEFSKGASVEVSSDEDGFLGAWFTATVVERLGNENYCIEYQSLRDDDDTGFLREEVDKFHIRPCPPEAAVVDRFRIFEEVDALYNDGWWVGVISKVLDDKEYSVFFSGTNEELLFKHSDLRLHQEWIAGKWVIASRALKL